MESVTSVLGAGSGIDITALVGNLAAAARKPKDDLFASRTTLNQERVKALADISSSVDAFADALESLVGGGALSTQPTSSDTSILTVSLTSGATINDVATTIEVNKLARRQTLESVVLAGSTTTVGQGTLTLHSSTGDFDVVIDSSNDSLSGLASAINDAGSGVTASVVTDSSGARLVLRGGIGAAQAFTLSVPSGTTSGLERFDYTSPTVGGLAQAQAAQDAELIVDGVTINSASNHITSLIDGVTIDLSSAKPGTVVNVGSVRPTAEISSAVSDFVTAYNAVMAQINEVGRNSSSGNGPLRSDIGLRDLRRRLAQMVSQPLISQGTGPRTLAEIGVKTNRDGTISLDSARLTTILASDPAGVEALFNSHQYSDNPLISINSQAGRVDPGSYAITGIVPAAGATPASGLIDGIAMTGIEDLLVAPASSAAAGLILRVASGATATATITIDGGLSGVLSSIRDSLTASGGAFAGSRERLTKEASAISAETAAHEARMTRYRDQLLKTYTAMDARVSAFKATEAYLKQQVAIWTNGDS